MFVDAIAEDELEKRRDRLGLRELVGSNDLGEREEELLTGPLLDFFGSL